MLRVYNREMNNESEQLPFIETLKDFLILPGNYNILHYVSYQNRSRSVDQALSLHTENVPDKYNNTPLMMAMVRNSNTVVTNMVQKAIDSEEMLKKISSFELCQIIEFSPENLKNFFDAAIHADDNKKVPKLGIIPETPSFLFDSKD